jgi:hypothetical protein
MLVWKLPQSAKIQTMAETWQMFQGSRSPVRNVPQQPLSSAWVLIDLRVQFGDDMKFEGFVFLLEKHC